MVYIFLNKKAAGGVVKNKIMLNQQLAEELQKKENLRTEKYTHFLQTIFIWGADVAHMQLMSK